MLTSRRVLLAMFVLLALGAVSVLDARPALASTLTVTDGGDSGPGTLRDTIAAANPGDTIVFANGVTTVTLTDANGELVVNKDLTIQGPGTNLLTVRRDPSAATGFRVFRIAPGISGVVTLSGMTISGGAAPAGFPFGGGVLAESALTIADGAVTGNSATGAGGGIAVAFTNLTVMRSTVSVNTSTQGGGFYIQDSVATVVNSTISGNIVTNTGAALQISSPSSPTQLTLTSSTVDGGPQSTIFSDSTVGTTLDLQSTIVAGAAGGSVIAGAGVTVVTHGHNLVDPQSDFPSGDPTDLIGLAPNLGPLANNGGPTQTRAMLAGSPAIDAGANGLLATDQRGQPRAGAGAGADIGALEVSSRRESISTGQRPARTSVPASPRVARPWPSSAVAA